MILLTGATGYIGSHAWAALADAGEQVVGLDSFVNSDASVLDDLAALGVDVSSFVQADVTHGEDLGAVFARWPIESVIHFAALKSVAESVAAPLRYYASNVGGLMVLLEAMERHRCKRIVFSSSATVYGDPKTLPIREDAALAPRNPYGETKLACENILLRLSEADAGWSVALLRYFNPVGAHPSGLLGEAPRGTPNNLMPLVAQVARGLRESIDIFGSDYPTRDGTGVRDYLHVQDLAEGHIAALRRVRDSPGATTVNLGTGTGITVLELVAEYERASGVPIPRHFAARRTGDVAACYADPTAAGSLLGWFARRDLRAMCADSWRFARRDPVGQRTSAMLRCGPESPFRGASPRHPVRGAAVSLDHEATGSSASSVASLPST